MEPKKSPTANHRKVAVKQPPVLFAETQKLLAAAAAKLDGPIVAYWNSASGSVCDTDVNGLYGVLRKLGYQKRLNIFIKSSGGNGQAALRLVNLLRQYCDRLVAVVPLECQSAATMLALGADEIHMGPLAHLSAVDTSLTHDLSPIDRDNNRVSVSQDEMLRIISLWKSASGGEATNPYQALYGHIHPLVIGAVHRASSLSTKLCVEILSYHLKDRRKAESISNRLNSDYPSHSYPITLREARRIGLHVRPLDPQVSELLFALNDRYSEMSQLALTDFDEFNYHDQCILNILEGAGVQVFYQNDKDMHYRQEERRWVQLNDKSSWHKMELVRGKPVRSVYHIR